MSSQNKNRISQQSRSIKVECCTEQECDFGLRNNYFNGKRLTPDSFQVEQKYMLERHRLLNRAIHGWGVVYGFEITIVEPDPCKKTGSSRLMIGAGLALDNYGRELYQCGTQIEIDDLIVLDKKNARHVLESSSSSYGSSDSKETDPSLQECWLLSAHYAEQSTAPVKVEDSCHCERKEWDHTCETVRYSLRRISCAECCCDFECGLNCDCGTGRCCDEPDGADHEERRHKPGSPRKRGGCRCLCDHLTHWAPKFESGQLCEIEESCARVRVDLRNGVPLACIDLVRDECDRWAIGEDVEACGPRRLVKRNDLLFDLIRGCDLTRISDFGWKDWHRGEISFKDFSEAFGPEGNHQAEYITEKFWVRFSRPVRQDTLLPDCFAMTVMAVEREGGWWQTFRVPIVRLETTDFPPEWGDPKDHVRGATIVVDGGWVEDGVRGRRNIFMGSETRVELEVRGDFIIDCNGQAVDANAAGTATDRMGNGTPGGAFLSTFLVAAHDAPPRTVPYDSGDRQKGVSS
jgi:hypothetical protein